MSSPFLPVDWIHSSNIYEVNLRQYTPEGSFAAFSREIPRLKDMGIEILWLMPITPISREKRQGSLGSYYACSDYTAVNPEFGDLDDFKRLVGTAHGLGLKVIIDWVANHTGWDHRWTREHPDFYCRNSEGNFFDAHGWVDVIDLNYDNKGLQEAMIEAMEFWVRECAIDGFRCDMAMLVPLDFWRSARTKLDTVKKLFWLAECEEIAYHEVFDTTYTWKFLHRMEAVWRKEFGIEGLDEVLQYYHSMFPPEAIRTYFTSNHDENSHSGSEYERLGDAAKTFAVLCCTWNGIPMIYSGQELPNYKRLKFFDKDPIEWTGQYALHDFYKTLLNLRKTNPALRAGDPSVTTYRFHINSGDKVFAFVRKQVGGEVMVLLNISGDSLSVRV
jgi:glycosidase